MWKDQGLRSVCQHLNYLHQFQNLCFALSGKEITVDAPYIQTTIENYNNKRQRKR
jgi:hypothetical protein